MGLIELKRTDTYAWEAKYAGRFGIYTIEVEANEKQFVASNCTCPDRNPVCKHIEIVRAVIADRIRRS